MVQEEASLHNLTPTVRFFRVVRARHSGPVKSDRLLSILLLLQTRARAPVGELADRLEALVGTVYRDIDALPFQVPQSDRGEGHEFWRRGQ